MKLKIKFLISFLFVLFSLNSVYGKYVQHYIYKIGNNCVRHTIFTTTINGYVNQTVTVYYQPYSGCTILKKGKQSNETIIKNGKIITADSLIVRNDDFIKLIQDFSIQKLVGKKLEVKVKDKLMEEQIESIISFFGKKKCKVEITPPQE